MNRPGTFRLPILLSSALLLISAAEPGFGAGSVTGPLDSFGGAPTKYVPTEADIWKESAVTLPPYPVDSDLVPLAPAPGDTLRVFVDRKSVTLGGDRVLRFTLVVQTSGGVRNVFYDGLRCETREYKTYAYGSANRELASIASASWQPIARYPTNAFRYRLRIEYACDKLDQARGPEDFLYKLEHDR